MSRRLRPTARFRLTVLYGGLFLASGGGLLTVAYLFVAYRLPVLAGSRGSTAWTRDGAQTCVPGPHQAELEPARLLTCDTELQSRLDRQRALELHQLLTVSGFAMAVMAGVSIALGWLVAGRVLRPLRTITAAVRDITAGNLHERLALTGPDDELRELGDTFDDLLGRLQSAFDAQRRFVANASHELRTPLARQRTLIEVALGDPGAGAAKLRATLVRVLAAGEQQEHLVAALLALARGQAGRWEWEPLDLALVTDQVLAARRADIRDRGLSVVADLDAVPILGEARLLEHLVANLLDNATQHNVPEGCIRLSTSHRAGRSMLSIANSGPLILPDDVDRLRQPFQRRGPDRTGRRLGLGLSIVDAIAQAHDATLTVRARPEGGLEVDVAFP